MVSEYSSWICGWWAVHWKDTKMKDEDEDEDEGGTEGEIESNRIEFCLAP